MNDRDQGGAIERRDAFEGTSDLATREAAPSTMAQAARAREEARWVMALRRPRVIDSVRVALLKECDRLGFAEDARYSKKQGTKWVDKDGNDVEKRVNLNGRWQDNPAAVRMVDNYVEGLSVRFAEAALQRMGNMGAVVRTILDDAEQRIVEVVVTDYETNASASAEVVVPKTIERRKLKKDQEPIGERINSSGDRVFIVEATEDEVSQSTRRLAAIEWRNAVLRLVPSDVKADCEARCIATIKRGVKEDPAGSRKRLVERFDKLGVSAQMLVEYMGGKPLDALTDEDHVRLAGLGSMLKNDGVPWGDALASSPYVEPAPDEKKAADPKVAQARERLAKRTADVRASARKPPGAAPAAPESSPKGDEPKTDAKPEAPKEESKPADAPAPPKEKDPAAPAVEPTDEDLGIKPGREPGQD